ncbi:hypothetical protein JW823_03850 [bacterium]|nr:hypothetical protein [candidate division CSSED10-310 bacterium]
MNAKMRLFSVAWMLLVCSLGVAQTPTPLPGTPLSLTCWDFTYLPQMGAVDVITDWQYLDRACVVLENTTGGAIEISGIEAYFSQTENPLIGQLRIWEVLNEQFLPDLPAAAVQVSDIYALGADPVMGSPSIALVTFDLEGYLGGTVPMPVINPGKKFVVDIINLLDEGGSGLPGMKVTAEISEDDCPGFWVDRTNIFGNQSGSTLTWNFKEDIGDETNFYIGVKYYDNAVPRTPAMGTIGIIIVVLLISCAMICRRK